MGSTIQSVVVSPKGTSYGVQLADNSMMVLSAATLLPTANIAGIQSNVLSYDESIDSLVKRVTEDPLEHPFFQRTPAVISSLNASKLLIGVGNAQETSRTKPTLTSIPFLQSFDLSSGQNLSRQALTRTNITGIIAAPDQYQISEPRVTHMQLSSDGTWLATVDEWIPPKQDIDFIKYQGMDVDNERQRRREIYLKFWQWIEKTETWDLVSRINDPHASEDSTTAPRILDLAADPTSLRFATIGEDGLVRTWSTTTRKRHGVVVRSTEGKLLRNWNCQHAISMGKAELEDFAKAQKLVPNGSVAFSEDGSLLAAACGENEHGLIHFLDPETGIIRMSQTHMYEGGILKLEFLGQDLITLSNKIIVWDLVQDQIKANIAIDDVVTTLAIEQKTTMVHLAVDRKSRTFAIALPAQIETAYVGENKKQPPANRYSELAVFHQDHREPVFQETFQTLITALLPAVSSDGFIVLDSAAEIRTILKKGTEGVTTLAQSTSAQHLDTVEAIPVSAIGEVIEEEEEEEEEIPPPVFEDKDEDAEIPVVTQQQLAAIFDIGPAYALPHLEELFYQVANLYAAPPLPQSVS